MATRRRLVRHDHGVITAAPATATRTPVIGRGVVVLDTDRGTRSRELLAMQHTAGNAAVQRAIGESTVVGHGTCSTPAMECTARADRTHDSAANLLSTKKTKDAEKNIVYKSVAEGKATFKATVDINLATVPDGLSDCATKKLQKLIDTKLKPHEEDHKRRFLTTNPKYAYVGSWKEKFSAIASDQATAEADAVAKAELAVTQQETKRSERNKEYAVDQIDPFSVTADISDCEECKGNSESE